MGVLTFSDFVLNQPSVKKDGESKNLPSNLPIEEKKIVEDDNILYRLAHPDNTQGGSINAKIDLEGEQLEIIYGKIETRKKSVYVKLLQRGYIPCANYEEITNV
jgi:hypothetical protein